MSPERIRGVTAANGPLFIELSAAKAGESILTFRPARVAHDFRLALGEFAALIFPK
jgi:hypothetical protein